MKPHWLGIWLGLFAATAMADRLKNFVIDPAGPLVVKDGECNLFRVKLLDANGEPADLIRMKKIQLTSTSKATSFFNFYDPPCADAVRIVPTDFIKPGEGEMRFHFRVDLKNRLPKSVANQPHDFTIAVNAHMTLPVELKVTAVSDDCGVKCRGTCVTNESDCAKSCDSAKNGIEKWKCRKACYLEQDECLKFCEGHDARIRSSECAPSRRAYCDVHYATCYGKCFYADDTRNTPGGAKCVDACMNQRLSCRRPDCGCD